MNQHLTDFRQILSINTTALPIQVSQVSIYILEVFGTNWTLLKLCGD